VFTKLHDERPEVPAMTEGRSFSAFYRVAYASKTSLVLSLGIVSEVDPQPPSFREAGRSRWTLFAPWQPSVEVGSLTAEQESWPKIPGIISHAHLLHHILRDNGIDIPVADLVNPEDRVRDGDSFFYLAFPRKRDAVKAAAAIELPEFLTKISKSDRDWELRVSGKVDLVDVPRVDAHLEDVAQMYGGKWTGHELPV
jgi:hypothetical protein